MFLEFDLKIKWIFTKKTDEKNQITGFKIMKFNDSIEFLGECSQFLYRLKELTATFFFSFNFQDDFTVIKPIGKGSSAIVFLYKLL